MIEKQVFSVEYMGGNNVEDTRRIVDLVIATSLREAMDKVEMAAKVRDERCTIMSAKEEGSVYE